MPAALCKSLTVAAVKVKRLSEQLCLHSGASTALRTVFCFKAVAEFARHGEHIRADTLEIREVIIASSRKAAHRHYAACQCAAGVAAARNPRAKAGRCKKDAVRNFITSDCLLKRSQHALRAAAKLLLIGKRQIVGFFLEGFQFFHHTSLLSLSCIICS